MWMIFEIFEIPPCLHAYPTNTGLCQPVLVVTVIGDADADVGHVGHDGDDGDDGDDNDETCACRSVA